KTLEELMTLRFLHQGENILFLGPCGVGKTHLATALALQAIESGHRVYFLTLHDLALKARKERARDRLEDLMRHLVRPELLILDTPSPNWSGHLGEVMLNLFEEEENGGISQGRRWAPAVHDRLQEGADRPRPPGRDYAFGACA